MRDHVTAEDNCSDALVMGDAEWPAELMRSPRETLACLNGDPMVAGTEDDPTGSDDGRRGATLYRYRTAVEAMVGKQENAR